MTDYSALVAQWQAIADKTEYPESLRECADVVIALLAEHERLKEYADDLEPQLEKLRDALDAETQGKYSELMMEMADHIAAAKYDAIRANKAEAELAAAAAREAELKAALTELLACKELKDGFACMLDDDQREHSALYKTYLARKTRAWERARVALAK